jgi:benzoyl-CoA reductase/2-hydroxyglutaryl-CoA dehydratase subunit BcrC/BadD/HgdB
VLVPEKLVQFTLSQLPLVQLKNKSRKNGQIVTALVADNCFYGLESLALVEHSAGGSPKAQGIRRWVPDVERCSIGAQTPERIGFQLSSGGVFGNLEQHLRQLSDDGRLVLGYVYPHAPLELLLAHGITPSLVSTRPSAQGGFEASLQTFSCSLTRNLFSQRSNGELSYLGGLLFPSNTCDSLHNVSDVWRRRFSEDKVFRLTYPAARPSNDSIQFLAEELRKLSQSLKEAYGRSLSIDAFSAAVGLVNGFRDAAQTLYSCRIVDPDVVSYFELTRMIRDFLTLPSREAVDRICKSVNAASQILKEKDQLTLVNSLHTELLNGRLGSARINVGSHTPRILVAGGMVEPTVVASLFTGSDRTGGEVIALDLLSYGFKTAFTPPVSLGDDLFLALSRSILGAPSEPTQEGLPERLEFLKRVISQLSIDGLVVCEQSFCDPDQFEAPSLVKTASELHVPSVRLPIDPELSDRNRLEGRVQSFIETMRGGVT